MSNSNDSKTHLAIPPADANASPAVAKGSNPSGPREYRTAGGGVGIQWGPTAEEIVGAPPSGGQGVHDGGSTRIHSDGRVESFGAITRATTGDLVARNADDIMSTAHTLHGAPPQQIGPDTLIDVHGQEMPIRTAIACGWVRNEGGRYVATGKHNTDRVGLGLPPSKLAI